MLIADQATLLPPCHLYLLRTAGRENCNILTLFSWQISLWPFSLVMHLMHCLSCHLYDLLHVFELQIEISALQYNEFRMAYLENRFYCSFWPLCAWNCKLQHVDLAYCDEELPVTTVSDFFCWLVRLRPVTEPEPEAALGDLQLLQQELWLLE